MQPNCQICQSEYCLKKGKFDFNICTGYREQEKYKTIYSNTAANENSHGQWCDMVTVSLTRTQIEKLYFINNMSNEKVTEGNTLKCIQNILDDFKHGSQRIKSVL